MIESFPYPGKPTEKLTPEEAIARLEFFDDLIRWCETEIRSWNTWKYLMKTGSDKHVKALMTSARRAKKNIEKVLGCHA